MCGTVFVMSWVCRPCLKAQPKSSFLVRSKLEMLIYSLYTPRMGCHDGGGGGDPLFSCATKSLPHFLLSHSKEDVFIRLDTIWSFLQLTFFTMASMERGWSLMMCGTCTLYIHMLLFLQVLYRACVSVAAGHVLCAKVWKLMWLISYNMYLFLGKRSKVVLVSFIHDGKKATSNVATGMLPPKLVPQTSLPTTAWPTLWDPLSRYQRLAGLYKPIHALSRCSSLQQ